MKTHNVWVEPPSLAELAVRLQGGGAHEEDTAAALRQAEQVCALHLGFIILRADFLFLD